MSDVIKKIMNKAKNFKFFAQKEFSLAGRSLFVCGQELATNPDFPNFYFVIDTNMIYAGSQLKDSSYTVYSFNLDGEYVEKLKMENLPADFMKNRVTLTKID